jgi:predicted Zn-dependent peptidase
MLNPELHTLSNGLRVLLLHYPDQPVSHCGLMIRAGTRDEPEGQEGLAHFIEHCLFKGTEKRKSFHILNRLEVIGGELNAYTTKEETCIHASVLHPHLERALELIADVAFHSVFPEKEMEKEKDVIIDEIHSYQDAPYEQIFDDLENIVFSGHKLGTPILGTEKSIKKFRRNNLVYFVKKQYHPSEMILVVSGSHLPSDVLKIAERYYNEKHSKKDTTLRLPFKKYRKSSISEPRTVSQVHYISGKPAYSMHHPGRYNLVLLNNILGGPGMNSRLNLNIREKYGYTYTIESGYHAYSDTGILHVYFATDSKNFVKTRSLVQQEFSKLCTKPLNSRVFNQYKEQLTGQIAMAQENRLSLMLSMAKGLLNFNRIILPEDVLRRIRAVTQKDLQATAEAFLGTDNGSELIYEPVS